MSDVIRDPVVRVRMYRQGLGDCFLISFDAQNADPFHILVDCGVFYGTSRAEEKMQNVAKDIEMSVGQEGLSLVIPTHEHWDHLSGFLQAREVFEQLSVSRVWAAWTEDPRNSLAQELREERAIRLLALGNVQKKLSDVVDSHNAGLKRLKEEIDNFIDFFGGDCPSAFERQTTGAALDYVLNKGDVRFCRPSEEAIIMDELPGVRFYILGPPEDIALISRSNPSRRNPEVYEALTRLDADVAFYAATQPDCRNHVVTVEDEERQARSSPFDDVHQRSFQAAMECEFLRKIYLDGEDWRRIDHDWIFSAEQLALALDSDTNNTSLAFAIELINSGRVLLFPGDAQVGNWLSWTKLSWQIKEPGGGARTVSIDDLLKRTVLYKVGHHGSHNATLREKGLELMKDPQLVAMIPVDEDFASKRPPRGWKMPFGPLYLRLQEKTKGRILRADSAWPHSGTDAKPSALTQIEWEAFRSAVTVDERGLYVEYTL